MEEGTVTTQSRARSYIIKRPRLTKILDESEARILLLVAPAGYGKTTLAREWLEGKEGVAWYSAGPSMADVAALAAGIAESFDPALTDRVRLLAASGQPPEALARAVARSEAAQSCLILALDDCHHAADSPVVTAFLADLIAMTGFGIVATSRVRPSWVTARMLVYGDAMAVQMEELTFTDAEALAVLGNAVPLTSGQLADARGWPAVIGLAAARRQQGALPRQGASENIYEFFADELLRSASSDLRRGLFLLALGAGADRQLARELLGADADEVLQEGSERGFLSLGDDATVVHPLLRGFLVARLRDSPPEQSAELVRQVVEASAARSLWDVCLATLEEFPTVDLLASTIGPALIALLDAGRSATAQRWLDLARKHSVFDPLMLMARAEIAVRQGDIRRGQALGERAGELLDDDLAARAFVAAARAAHLGDDHSSAMTNARRAEAAAVTPTTKIAALWTQLVSGMEKPDGELRGTLERLQRLSDDSPEFALRLAFARGSMLFNVELDARAALQEFEAAASLLDDVDDPILRTSFFNFYAYVSQTGGRYERALDLTARQVEEAHSAGLEFPIDHALITRAAALIGLRKLRHGQQVIDELRRRAPAASPHVLESTRLLAVRMCIATGDLTRAATLLKVEHKRALGSVAEGETFAHQALVLFSLGQSEEAQDALRRAEGQRRFGAYSIAKLATAIGALVDSHGEAGSKSNATLGKVLRVGGVDAVVTACRAFPDLARMGARDRDLAQALLEVFSRSRDIDLGRRIGLVMPRELRRSDGFTPREEEVYALLAQGRTNGEIARTLFISESTTKVHVRHIFDKLGVHTRAEAARVFDASQVKAGMAASVTTEMGTGTSPSS